MALKSFVCRPAGNGGIEIGLVDKTGNLRTMHVGPDRLSEVLGSVVSSMAEAARPRARRRRPGRSPLSEWWSRRPSVSWSGS